MIDETFCMMYTLPFRWCWLPIKIWVKQPQRLTLPLSNEAILFELFNPRWLCERRIAEHDHLVQGGCHMFQVEILDELVLYHDIMMSSMPHCNLLVT